MRDSDDEHEKLEGLLKAVAETKLIAPKLIDKGRNLTEAGQSALDWASSLEKFAKASPDGFFRNRNFDYVVSGIREFNLVAGQQYVRITTDKELILLSQANMTTAVVSASEAHWTFQSSEAEILEFRALTGLLHRSVDVAKVKESMEALSLNVAHGSLRSPLQLLETAEEALKRPFANEGYATAVLVPLRESIQSAVDQLLKRRPIMKKVSGWEKKVTSIAEHFGSKVISSDLIDRVAVMTRTLIDALSGAKDRDMTREQISSFFDQGVSLLRDILSLIDPARLQVR